MAGFEEKTAIDQVLGMDGLGLPDVSSRAPMDDRNGTPICCDAARDS
jgi:hypothetical protein